MKTQTQIPINSYRPGGFIGRYQKLVRNTVIPYQYDVLCDRAQGAEKSHVVMNFVNAAKALKNEPVGDGFYGMVFQDSDAAKWLEAVAYSLSLFPDKSLEKTADELIEKIAAAQDNDGYLNTYFTIKDREKRWKNLLEGHELYCAGHMMEAACAYYEATGKDILLKVMLKNAAHIYDVFITNGHEGYPGHPEVELALMKMYRLTGDERTLKLAEHFINSRGVDADYFRREMNSRDWTVWGANGNDGDYQQSGRPVRKQTDATGHAVRAVYLYTGMADLASEEGDAELFAACKKLWTSITQRRMYITGGIGSTVHGEAFSVDYDLPDDTAYAETCASIGLMFFASRMLENEINGEYADILETAFYNTVLAGMQLDGKSFFYVNPLECIPGISGIAPTHRHTLPKRPGWYTCACCPPNAARLISSFGKYAYGENAETAFCHMYADGEITFKNGMYIKCHTAYPYDFTINYEIIRGGSIAIHIPSWSKTVTVRINSAMTDVSVINGYIYLNTADNDSIEIVLDGKPRFVYASSRVHNLTGRAAICRGPLVYCFEGTDNGDDVFSLSLIRSASITETPSDELGQTIKLSVPAIKTLQTEPLYSDACPQEKEVTATAVPYYTWCNRGQNQMRVWMNVK